MYMRMKDDTSQGLWVRVFNATFNNISVISWRPNHKSK